VHSSVAGPFTSHSKRCNHALSEAKTIFLSQNPYIFHFSSSNFNVQDHILSTAGDALRGYQRALLLDIGLLGLRDLAQVISLPKVQINKICVCDC